MFNTITAYKLLRLRRNGTLGPLFIDRKLVIRENTWLRARAVPTKGFAFRPGWHACSEPRAPHLTTKGRVWRKVVLKGAVPHQRPDAQGGLWYTAKQMLVVPGDIHVQ